MSEFEKDVNEMEAPELLEQHRRAHPNEGQDNTPEWAVGLVREFEADAKQWHHRQGWTAFWLGFLSLVTATGCAGALACGVWQPVVTAVGLINLVLAGGWLHKAKAGWSA